MKKIIYSLLVLAMTAMTFSSCEDVPAPYPMPEESGNNGGGTTTETDGTEANPYTVTDAIKAASGTSKFVKGYIVGYIPKDPNGGSTYIDNTVFGNTGDNIQATNIVIAASADETSTSNCMAVQISGDIRTALNLQDNPGNYKKEVILCGNIEKYFGAMGVKSVVWAKIDNKEVGTKPGDTPDMTLNPKGTGTEADPFNVDAAIKYINEGGDANTEQYIKGKIVEIEKFDTEKYFSAYYYIADEGSSNKLYVYSGKGLDGADIKTEDAIKVGQTVVILGKLKKYNSTLEVDKTNKIISIDGESGGVTPDPTPAGNGLTAAAIKSGLTSSEFPTNSYGTSVKQDVTNEETWVTWNYDNISYKGAKICQATGDFTGCIQVQGNASNTANQGFLFNSTAFSKEIKSITLVIKGLSKYGAPNFGVFHGSEAHPTTNAVVGTNETTAKGESIDTYTFTYDFSSTNSKFFTIWKNTQGALYIEKIVITLK